MYQDVADSISFGDIFSGGWFFDAYLRQDAIPLKPFQRKGGTEAYEPAKPTPQRDLVLAHGKSCQAILLADDCEAESIVVRKSGKGRLLFAALTPWPSSEEEADKARQIRGFRRHPLPPGNGFAGGIVELQHLFVVHATAVNVDPDPRASALDTGARLELEMRWNAYATRRGPLSHLDNAEKLAHLLEADGDPDVIKELFDGDREPAIEPAEAARQVAIALGMAWRIEGEVLNRVADALERGAPADDSRTELSSALADLGSVAQKASDLLAP